MSSVGDGSWWLALGIDLCLQLKGVDYLPEGSCLFVPMSFLMASVWAAPRLECCASGCGDLHQSIPTLVLRERVSC